MRSTKFQVGDEVKINTESQWPEYGVIVRMGRTIALVCTGEWVVDVRIEDMELQNRPN